MMGKKRIKESPLLYGIAVDAQLDVVAANLHPEPTSLLHAHASAHSLRGMAVAALHLLQLLDGCSLDLSLNLLDDGGQVVAVLQLQFLMVGTALVGRPPPQDFGESIKDLVSATRALALEILVVSEHEAQVEVVFVGTPPAVLDPLGVGLEPQFLNLVVFWVERVRVRTHLAFPCRTQQSAVPPNTAILSAACPLLGPSLPLQLHRNHYNQVRTLSALTPSFTSHFCSCLREGGQGVSGMVHGGQAVKIIQIGRPRICRQSIQPTQFQSFMKQDHPLRPFCCHVSSLPCFLSKSGHRQ